MSILYSIDIMLNLPYVEKNIKYILARGLKKQFFYFEDYLHHSISIDKAVQNILYLNSENDNCHVIAKFQDTIFLIWFFNVNDNQIIFSIGSFSYRWDRDFSNGVEACTIDFARYIRLMLQVCKEVPIYALETFSDAAEYLHYEGNDCVMAAVDIGFFGEQVPGSIDCGRLSVGYFLTNGMQNGFDFFDENTQELIEPSIQKYYDILKADFPAYLYAKKDGTAFKIEIKRGDYDFVSIYPLEPYRMKKGYENEEKKLDVAFYVMCLIELCENFAIYELKTFF